MENIQITHECVKAINNIGNTTYQNICNGTFEKVPWGTGDWVSGVILALFLVGAFFMLLMLGRVIYRESNY